MLWFSRKTSSLSWEDRGWGREPVRKETEDVPFAP